MSDDLDRWRPGRPRYLTDPAPPLDPELQADLDDLNTRMTADLAALLDPPRRRPRMTHPETIDALVDATVGERTPLSVGDAADAADQLRAVADALNASGDRHTIACALLREAASVTEQRAGID